VEILFGSLWEYHFAIWQKLPFVLSITTNSYSQPMVSAMLRSNSSDIRGVREQIISESIKLKD